jgi:hypothetical protein
VIVRIDDGEAGFGNGRRLGDQLLARQVLFDIHVYLF